jgi:hypothetical protein
MIRWLAGRRWGRLLLAPVVIAACGWSWLTYVFGGLPSDKKVYWADAWGWDSPEMWHHWAMLRGSHPAFAAERVSTFHELKNIGSEWARAWPQTAVKVLSMIIVVLFALLVIAAVL